MHVSGVRSVLLRLWWSLVIVALLLLRWSHRVRRLCATVVMRGELAVRRMRLALRELQRRRWRSVVVLLLLLLLLVRGQTRRFVARRLEMIVQLCSLCLLLRSSLLREHLLVLRRMLLLLLLRHRLSSQIRLLFLDDLRQHVRHLLWRMLRLLQRLLLLLQRQRRRGALSERSHIGLVEVKFIRARRRRDVCSILRTGHAS